MIEQLSNQGGSIAALKGKGGKAIQGGLFAKFLAAFQAQIKQNGQLSAAMAAQTGQAAPVTKAGLGTDISGQKVLAGEEKQVPVVISKYVQTEPSEKSYKTTGSTLEKLMLSQAERPTPQNELKNTLQGGDKTADSKAPILAKESVVAGLGEALVDKSKTLPVQANLLSVVENRGEKSGKKPFAEIGNRVAYAGGDGEKGSGLPLFSQLSDKGEKTQKQLETGIKGEAPIKVDALIKETSVKAGPFIKESSVRGDPLADAVQTDSRKTTLLTSEAKSVRSPLVESLSAPDKPLQGGSTPAVNQLSDGKSYREQLIADQAVRTRAVAASVVRKGSDSVEVQATQADVVVNPAVQNKAKVSAQPQVQFNQLQQDGMEKTAMQNREFGSGSSQQDMGRGSQQAEALLGDSAKSDVKGVRGSDFAAQLNYKTAQAYKPADVMLEIARSAKDGSMKLEMQLDPAHLGKIQVTLQSDAAKQLQVHIVVEQSVSRQVIEQHLPQLRTALAEQGLDLGQFSMNMSSQEGRQDGESGGERSAFSEFSSLNGEPGEQQDGSSMRLGINTASDGRISILA